MDLDVLENYYNDRGVLYKICEMANMKILIPLKDFSVVIALISAYDISNENELLEIAEMMLNKMYEVDSTIIYAHINEWQIMKRKNTISDEKI